MAGDLLVRGAVALARRAHVSQTLVAATVVAFGTSIPELVVAVQATITSHQEIVLGNVIGSNIANVLLVGGAAALVFPLVVDRLALRRDSLSMIGVSFVFVLMAWTTGLTRAGGAILLAGLFMVWGFTARVALKDYQSHDDTTPLEWVLGLPSHGAMIGLFLTLGVIGLPVGAKLVVDSAVEIAAQLGVTETVVGLTLIAFSTSLPELATAVIAALQRRTELAVGTIVGSNILNIVGIMGLSLFISPSPIEVSRSVLALDLPVMIAASLILTFFVWVRKPIGRVAGAMLVTVYAAYMLALFAFR